MRDIDTSLLRAFVGVVDAGTFSRAARRLNRTQSALSMQIKRLEEVVEASLFERSVRPPVITPAGEALLSHARQILAINDTALTTVRATEAAGQVRLGIMEDFAATRLAPILGRFLERHPAVRVEVHTGLTSGFVPQLGARYDIVVAMLQAGHPDGEVVRRGASLWAAAPGFEPGRHETLPLALFPHGCLFRKWATDALDAAGRPWRTGLVCSSLGGVTAAVREGWALSVFKDSTLPPDLVPLGEAHGLPALPDHEIRLLRAPSARAGAARALADFLAESLHADRPDAARPRREPAAVPGAGG